MLTKLLEIKTKFAQSATLHWLMQRLTAVALIPLTIQVLIFLDFCLNSPYQQTVVWLKSPLNLIGLQLWLIMTTYHAALGLQVVVEDYIAAPELQTVLIKLINFVFVLMAVVALFFIFRIL